MGGKMKAVGVVLLVLLGVVLAAGLFVAGVQIVNLNVNDIISNGVNFWNVFWLSLVGVAWFGTASKVSQ